MEELRSMYELPYMAHFIATKKEQLKFADIDIRGFEASICDIESKLFEDIVCRLLRHIKQSKEIKIASCEKHLKTFADETKSDISHLVKTEIKSIAAPDKLRILKWLADQTKEKKNDLDEMLNEEFGADDQDPTIINVGQDSENRTYWYFDDLRLYRQKNGQPKTNCDWQCLATDFASWENLVKKFSLSTDEQEIELYTYLSNCLYPAIKPLIETQPKEAKTLSNEELISNEERTMEGKVPPGGDKSSAPPIIDQSEQIKSENPELSKVLSEEPSSTARGGSTHMNDTKKSGGVSFTQQQSNQLFVFSTRMANRAVDAIMAGVQSSLLLFHVADADTKQFVEANQMKVVLPNPQSRHPMPLQRATNPFRQPRAGGPPSQQVPLQWNGAKGGMPPGMPIGGYSQPMMPRHMAGSPCTPMPGYMNTEMKSPMGGHPMLPQPDISHQIVPNENLTPDQRQNRESGLASLRKIHQMLLADEGEGGPVGNINPMTSDFSHIHMAQDRQGPYLPPCSQSNSLHHFGINQQMGAPPGAMYGPGPPMSPANPSGMMESKPPPPYPMPSPGPATQPPPKKPGRKRKTSSVVSPAPTSPRDQPPVKMEKQAIPPSPLANHGTNVTPQGAPMTSQPGGQISGPRTPQQAIPKSEELTLGMPGPMRGVMQQQSLARQHSLPNFPQGRSGPQPPGSYRMLQAGQPTPYQNSQMAGAGDAPPSYNNSLRRGVSMESMNVPPSQRQQYLQPENQERLIERQLNVTHHSSIASQPGDQQGMYSNATSSSQSQNFPSSTGTDSTNPLTNPLTNITSTSLANLAKGMEQNISEMSQKMSQGGPFGDMQNTSNPETNGSEQPSNNAPPSSASNNPQQPSVNNTFVNAHMSIGQVNIQNVTANQTYQGPGMHGHMQQNVDVSMNNFGGMPAGPQPDPMYKPPQPATPAVSIQRKGRNTIQYLPVSQPSIAPSHDPAIPPKQNFDFMSSERFPSPTPNFLPGENPHMPLPAGAPHQRHPVSMYGGPMHPPGGGHMMSSGGPPGTHLTESIPRGPQSQYMMSAQQSSMSMGYNQTPAPGAPHPGMMESHMHMRSQHMMMSGSYPGHPSPGMPPSSYGAPVGYAPPPGMSPAGMSPYGPPPGAEYMPPPSGHPMSSRMPPMQQSMMISPHQGAPYMGNPTGPPYM